MSNYNLLFIINKIFNLINDYYKEKKNFFDILIDKSKNNLIDCNDVKVNEYLMMILIFLFIIKIILIIYYILNNVYNYIQLSIFFYFKNNKRLIDSPLFNQIINIYYLNDYLSFDYMFLSFILIPIFTLLFIYFFEEKSNLKNNFNLLKIFCIIIIFIGTLYFIINYNNITNLGKRVNSINNLIYNNINIDFINSENFCNYLNKKNDYDYKFSYGKCNNLSNNISISKLYNYIKKITLEIGQTIAPIQNITINNFKLLKDKNGILYKDKIKTAFFTFQLIKYYIDNDLEDEAKDFFSTFNLLFLKKTNNIIRTKINPVLYLRYDDIILFNKILEYNNEMNNSFGGNKNIYNYIYKEYMLIQNNVQNIVIDIYNICVYKLISIYVYYFIIFLIMLFIIIYYIYNHLK